MRISSPPLGCVLAKFVTTLAVLSLILQSAPASAAPSRQSSNGDSLLQSCAEIDENELQDRLNELTQPVFRDARTRLNLEELVARHWNALEMDARLAEAVTAGVADAKQKTDGFQKFLSGLNPATAEELANKISESTFLSTDFAAALEELTSSVGNEIEKELLKSSIEAYSEVLYCLQTFLGDKYSQAMADAITSSLSGQINVDEDVTVSPDTIELIKGNIAGISGISVIVVTQLTRKLVAAMLEKVGDRIAGSLGRRVAGNLVKRILGRIGTEVIPLVGWLLGSGLIIYDVATSLDGAIPIIEEALNSPETRSHIRGELSAQLNQEMRLAEELPTVARDIADSLYEEWRIVRRQMSKVLDLADQNDRIRVFYETVESGESLSRLIEIVDTLPMEGLTDTLEAAIASGALDKAISMPESVAEVVRDTGSIDTAVAWGEIAGSSLDDLVVMELHKIREPETFDKHHLKHMLALRDKWQAQRVLSLTNEPIDQLVELPVYVFTDLVMKLSTEQLGWLADQLSTLPPETANHAVDAVRSDPALLSTAMSQGTLCGVAIDCGEPSSPSGTGGIGVGTGQIGSLWSGILDIFPLANWLLWGVAALGAVLLAMFAIGLFRRAYRFAFGDVGKDKQKQN